MRGGQKTIIEPHRHTGVYIARGKEDALVSKNLVPGNVPSQRSLSEVVAAVELSALRAVVRHLLRFSAVQSLGSNCVGYSSDR